MAPELPLRRRDYEHAARWIGENLTAFDGD